MKVHPLLRRRQGPWLLLTLGLGVLVFFWQLGATGLVDETPPLFAAAARAMAETGDWLIPRVNGLPRYDKPPLVYWLMGLIYGLPAQMAWNPLGTWAARFPSALGAVLVMLALCDTLLRWPQPALAATPSNTPTGPATALGAALAFALSPLALLWGRTAVSDSLFTATLALALLWGWRSYASGGRHWWWSWLLLGLAVLTKGPVAVVLAALTWLAFGWFQGDPGGVLRSLRPLRGLALTTMVTLPWYVLALGQEGEPYWRSFFGYHNFQRFAGVVNNHLQPWWFFAPVLAVASLPATPLLLLGLGRTLGQMRWLGRWSGGTALRSPPPTSLARFATCWLLAVLLFFSIAATKLPSYWLPATPAAALVVALVAAAQPDRALRWAWGISLAITGLIGVVFLAAPRWLPLIRDPELPSLGPDLLASGLLPLAAFLWLLAAVLGLWKGLWKGKSQGKQHASWRLLALQAPLLLFVPLVLVPAWSLGDRLRGLPVRQMAAAVLRQSPPAEPLAMVGILKPSLHYYSRRLVIYEGVKPRGLVNLADRLRYERRRGQIPTTPDQQPSVLVVIDQATAAAPHWQGLQVQELGRAGLYRLWRVDRRSLEQRAGALRADGVALTWRAPVPERY
ncbi:MAG: glycosyltransferase family 39 protein [Cyanobacteria bacterium]|nr:glycosyltransferase family 39 protein [Cyanobacteriota bacterium]